MPLIKTIDSASQLRDEFHLAGRGNQFSYEAYEWIFDYFEEFDSTELDVVGICCDFSEDSFRDVASNFGLDLSEFDDEDDEGIREFVLDYLSDNTSIVGSNESSVVYICF